MKDLFKTIFVVVSFILFIAFIVLSIVMLVTFCCSLIESGKNAKLYVINFLISSIVSGIFGGIGFYLVNE